MNGDKTATCHPYCFALRLCHRDGFSLSPRDSMNERINETLRRSRERAPCQCAPNTGKSKVIEGSIGRTPLRADLLSYVPFVGGHPLCHHGSGPFLRMIGRSPSVIRTLR